MGALSLTGSKPQQKRRFSPLVPGVTHMRYPYAYRGCTGGPQEEEAFSLGCARYIEEKLFKTILPPEEVAAIFIEPIQGEGGYVVAPTNFLRELRAICDRHGILLVVDEVQSGAGRTGKWWAIEHSGVEPDMVCMAKGIASGMPLGICMSARRSWTGCPARTHRPSAAIRSRLPRRWPPWTSWSAKRSPTRPAWAA